MYVLKLVKDFLDRLLEKNSDLEVIHLPLHENFISGIFINPIPLSADVASLF